MKIEELIAEMQEVKQQYPDRSIDEILKLFEINALIELNNVIRISK